MTRYRTPAGSRVTITGEHRGITEIVFDWFEEGACPEAHPAVEIFLGEAMLVWGCGCCEPGSARLEGVS
jgi:hypothetical protein